MGAGTATGDAMGSATRWPATGAAMPFPRSHGCVVGAATSGTKAAAGAAAAVGAGAGAAVSEGAAIAAGAAAGAGAAIGAGAAAATGAERESAMERSEPPTFTVVPGCARMAVT
jgi:hypothetical protein